MAKNPPLGLLSVLSEVVVEAEPENENFGASFGASSFFSVAAPPPKLKTGGFFVSVVAEEVEVAPNEKDGLAGSSFFTGDFVVIVGAVAAAAGAVGVGALVSLAIEVLLLLGTISASTHFVS